MQNMEEFRLITGLIFEQALDAFPNATCINEQRIFLAVWNDQLPEMGELDPLTGRYESEPSKEQSSRLSLIESTRQWLVDENFLRQGGSLPGMEPPIVLTAKGHTVLGSTPEELLGHPNYSTLADRLKEQIQEGAWESVKQIVTHSLVTATTIGAKAMVDL
ncbi:hypothetical protein RAN53_13045 [Halomonas sp. SSL-5]|uniref:hypothetical protein n=1 Tax=Halomonas sp. SSL-5 TaxID=3065855 RepID=UPI002739ED08|nr:hypothetical protein [Halomonas sp. SSL-5]MDY7117274.1 hypothetical protein [Halomonas sp. SSL-5]